MDDKKNPKSSSQNTDRQERKTAVAEVTKGATPPTSQGQTAPGKAKQNE